jgi:hypothetical protein
LQITYRSRHDGMEFAPPTRLYRRPRMLKFLASTVGIIFLIGLLVIIGLLMLIF